MSRKNVFEKMGIDTQRVVDQVVNREVSPATRSFDEEVAQAPARRAARSHVSMELARVDFPTSGHVTLMLVADEEELGREAPEVSHVALNDIPLQVDRTEVGETVTSGGRLGRMLVISASSPHADRMAERLRHAPVVVEGRLGDSCRFSAYRKGSGQTAR